MNATSAWLLNSNAKLNRPGLTPDHEQQAGAYTFKVFLTGDSCWLVASWPKGSRIAFRLAYSPDDRLEIKKIKQTDGKVTIRIASMLGDYEAVVGLVAGET